MILGNASETNALMLRELDHCGIREEHDETR
jgi:hypothetical protein